MQKLKFLFLVNFMYEHQGKQKEEKKHTRESTRAHIKMFISTEATPFSLALTHSVLYSFNMSCSCYVTLIISIHLFIFIANLNQLKFNFWPNFTSSQHKIFLLSLQVIKNILWVGKNQKKLMKSRENFFILFCLLSHSLLDSSNSAFTTSTWSSRSRVCGWVENEWLEKSKSRSTAWFACCELEQIQKFLATNRQWQIHIRAGFKSPSWLYFSCVIYILIILRLFEIQ